MKSNSQAMLARRLYLGDIDGDGRDEFIQTDGRHLYIFRSTFELEPVLEHVFPVPINRLFIGDFALSGREAGKDQICAKLSDGTVSVFAISDDLKSLWWWFTQPNFIANNEHIIVGDFDGDGADDLMLYRPDSVGLRMFSKLDTGYFGEMPRFALGNLVGRDLTNKTILAGDFGQQSGRCDIVVVDAQHGQLSRFDSVTENGINTFWWSFTTRSDFFKTNDEICIANIDGGPRDDIIIREAQSGDYRLHHCEYDSGGLLGVANVDKGQLPFAPLRGRIVAAKVRGPEYQGEPGGPRRDDVLFFEEASGELT